MHTSTTMWTILAAVLAVSIAQLPPRLSIPGAIPIAGARPAPYRPQRVFPGGDFGGVAPKIRRPQPGPPPAAVRPVVEESDDSPPPTSSSAFDDEVGRLGLGALQSAVRQAEVDDAPSPPPQRPLQFRPERPAPRIEAARARAPPPQPQRVRPQPIDDDDETRTRKPPVQILRKYRTDNADGSITWGYENEDGTFKEETLGNDCVTRGKYGYIDPDGVRREYTYETGNKCDDPEEEEELAARPLPKQGGQSGKKLGQPLPAQFRPAPSQFQ